MINDAHVFLAGYVATQPTITQVGGSSTTKMRIGYNSRRLNRETGEWTDGPTSFVGVQCWRALADNVAVCLRKGDPVLVRGRLQVRRYENSEGAPRIAVEVEASSIGHDLTRGVAHFSRTRRSAGETAAELAETAEQPRQVAGDPPAEGPAEHGSAAGEPAAAAVDGAPGMGLRAAGSPAGHAPEDGISAASAGVVDERAVEELARELSDSMAEDREVSVPA